MEVPHPIDSHFIFNNIFGQLNSTQNIEIFFCDFFILYCLQRNSDSIISVE